MSRVVHFEIHVENPDRACKFYTDLFDWQITKWDGPMDYWMIKTGPDDQRGINGGMVRRMGAIDGQAVIAYVCTVGVANVDEAIAKATASGVPSPCQRCPFLESAGWLMPRTPKATSSE